MWKPVLHMPGGAAHSQQTQTVLHTVSMKRCGTSSVRTELTGERRLGLKTQTGASNTHLLLLQKENLKDRTEAVLMFVRKTKTETLFCKSRLRRMFLDPLTSSHDLMKCFYCKQHLLQGGLLTVQLLHGEDVVPAQNQAAAQLPVVR